MKSSIDAIVIGDLVRPDEATTLLLNCEQIAPQSGSGIAPSSGAVFPLPSLVRRWQVTLRGGNYEFTS